MANFDLDNEKVGGGGVRRVSRGVLEERDISHDYSKVLHRNMFRPARRLGLVGLGFFGPHEKDANYNVDIIIEDVQTCKTLYSAQFNNISAKKKEMFWVHFEKVFNLDPKRSYYIAFQLYGPPTGRLNSGSVIDELKDKPEEDKGLYYKNNTTETLFYFFEGSMQMPEMKYVDLY